MRDCVYTYAACTKVLGVREVLSFTDVQGIGLDEEPLEFHPIGCELREGVCQQGRMWCGSKEDLHYATLKL